MDGATTAPTPAAAPDAGDAALKEAIKLFGKQYVDDFIRDRTAIVFKGGSCPNGQPTVLRCLLCEMCPTEVGCFPRENYRLTCIVLGVVKIGFACAPSKQDAKKDPDAKPLFQPVYGGGSSTPAPGAGQMIGVKFFSFVPERANTDRGVIDLDISASIVMGDILDVRLTDMTFKGQPMLTSDPKAIPVMRFVMPQDVPGKNIPRLSIVDIHITPKNNTSTTGYGFGLKRIVTQPGTLYSYLPELSAHLPRSYVVASELTMIRKAENSFIREQIGSNSAYFMVRPPPGSYVSKKQDREGFHNILPPVRGSQLSDSVNCVEVSEADLFKYTNSSDIDRAALMIDLAGMSGSLSLLCWYQSWADHTAVQFRCVPIIDTNAFLRTVTFTATPPESNCIALSDEFAVYPMPDVTSIKGIQGKPVLVVARTPHSSPDGTPVTPYPCPDLAFIAPDHHVVRGYKISVCIIMEPFLKKIKKSSGAEVVDHALDHTMLSFVYNVAGFQTQVSASVSEPQQTDYAAMLTSSRDPAPGQKRAREEDGDEDVEEEDDDTDGDDKRANEEYP